MIVDDATADYQQIMKEKPNCHIHIPNVDDTGGTLRQSMKKNVDGAF